MASDRGRTGEFLISWCSKGSKKLQIALHHCLTEVQTPNNVINTQSQFLWLRKIGHVASVQGTIAIYAAFVHLSLQRKRNCKIEKALDIKLRNSAKIFVRNAEPINQWIDRLGNKKLRDILKDLPRHIMTKAQMTGSGSD